MKKIRTTADAGSVKILLGTDGEVNFPVFGSGDGEVKVYVMSNKEFREYQKEHFEKYGIETRRYLPLGFTYEKRFAVADYDCAKPPFDACNRYFIESKDRTTYFYSCLGCQTFFIINEYIF